MRIKIVKNKNELIDFIGKLNNERDYFDIYVNNVQIYLKNNLYRVFLFDKKKNKYYLYEGFENFNEALDFFISNIKTKNNIEIIFYLRRKK